MKKVRPWVEALGISEDDYQRWCSSVPADESVTFRCLREGRIPVEAYLDWASQHYELPILKSDFFKNPADVQLFEKLKSIGSWSREIMPVGEWDGVIYLACAEPLEDAAWSFNVCYLLAAPEALEEHWRNLNGIKIDAAEPPSLDEETPFPQAPSIPTPADLPVAAAEQTEQDNPLSKLKPKAPPTAVVTVNPTPAQTPTSTPTPATPAAAKEADPFAAIEMELTKTAVNAASSGPSGFEGLSGFANAPAVPTAATPEGLSASAPEGLSGLDSAPAVPTSASETPPEMPVNTMNMPDGMTLPDIPEHTVTSIMHKLDLGPQTSSSTSSVVTSDPSAIQSVAQDFFKELKTDFSGCMLMSFEGENLKVLAWDETWKAPAQTALISLTNASAFRVVFRTKMPYLGHVVETPANSDFFKAWGFTQMPENILVQPLMEEKKWYGMLLLIADKNKKQSSLLTLAEQVAARISNVLAKASASKAA